MNKRKQAKGGEKKSSAITWKTLSSDRGDRSDNGRWYRKSSISAIVVAAIATIAESGFQMIATIAAMAELFFFPQRSQRS